jgi:hypothetical protein
VARLQESAGRKNNYQAVRIIPKGAYTRFRVAHKGKPEIAEVAMRELLAEIPDA